MALKVTLNSVRRTLRTAFAVLVGAAAIAPLIYAAAAQGDPGQATGLLAAVLAVAAGVTRVMALPAVEVFLQKYASWIAAKPNTESMVITTGLAAQVISNTPGADANDVRPERNPETGRFV